MQAVRIESTRREVFLLQSRANWEQSWAQKKERLSQSQATKVESAKHGSMCEEVCASLLKNL